MDRSRAIILQTHEDAIRMAASGARISTQAGNALEIYERSGDKEKDLKLISKVMASGHRSVIEHQFFSIAFNDVSVLVEQFMIEFRLASYTVKSRRYVNFSDAGFVIPTDMNEAVSEIYAKACKRLFSVYDQLIEMDIPKEDARFVLPYGFRSNFFVTVNARELMLMIEEMLYGRGCKYAELGSIGEQLKEQFETIYPNIFKSAKRAHCAAAAIPEVNEGSAIKPTVSLFSQPANAKETLEQCMAYESECSRVSELLTADSSRCLEYLNYGIEVKNLSLACVTHFTRHRMLTLQTRNELFALSRGNYVLPNSIADNLTALQLYKASFAEQKIAVEAAIAAGAAAAELAYFAMAGHTTDIMISMNAREACHFAKLRTCSRAQWEIRNIARDMVRKLAETELSELFKNVGPDCMVTGKCPEGKMSCGNPIKTLL